MEEGFPNILGQDLNEERAYEICNIARLEIAQSRGRGGV